MPAPPRADVSRKGTIEQARLSHSPGSPYASCSTVSVHESGSSSRPPSARGRIILWKPSSWSLLYTSQMTESRLATCSGASLSSLAPAGRRTSIANFLARATTRSEEHTSELESRLHLLCRLLLE